MEQKTASTDRVTIIEDTSIRPLAGNRYHHLDRDAIARRRRRQAGSAIEPVFVFCRHQGDRAH